jgi:hypothetical protein
MNNIFRHLVIYKGVRIYDVGTVHFKHIHARWIRAIRLVTFKSLRLGLSLQLQYIYIYIYNRTASYIRERVSRALYNRRMYKKIHKTRWGHHSSIVAAMVFYIALGTRFSAPASRGENTRRPCTLLLRYRYIL